MGNEDAIQNKPKSKVHQYTTENIVNETVKIDDKNIFDVFKDQCGNRFIHTDDEERCIATKFQKSNPKRKRKQHSMTNQDVKEVKEENELLGQIQNNYTKMQN